MDCGIVSLGHLVGPHGYLSYNEFKAKKILSVSSAKMLKKLYYTCCGIAPKSRTTGLMYRDGFIPASYIVLM